MGSKESADIEEIFKPEIHPKIIEKETKIQEYKGQHSIKLPKIILEAIGVGKGDKMILKYNTESGEYSINFEKKNATKKTTSSN